MTCLLSKSAKYLFLLLLSIAASAGAAYDAGWTRSECSTYSYHGLNERYVYGGNKGWIDNNSWDSSSVEGVDCASYVCRCLALPGYVAENQSASYPYATSKLYAGVDHLVRINNINDLQPWDIWVWRVEYGGPSTGHTGLFKEFSGTSSIVTREALSATIGVVERTRRKQDMIDWGSRFYRRDNWASGGTATVSSAQIDNGSSGTSSTGTWGVSSAAGSYGSNSLWARNGATYTWRFTPPSAGTYEVYMWWTEYSSRGTAVPVAISHATGTASLTVNQQTDGGQWNLLGTYYFNGAAAVKLTAAGSYPTSNCADAVRFVKR